MSNNDITTLLFYSSNGPRFLHLSATDACIGDNYKFHFRFPGQSRDRADRMWFGGYAVVDRCSTWSDNTRHVARLRRHQVAFNWEPP